MHFTLHYEIKRAEIPPEESPAPEVIPAEIPEEIPKEIPTPPGEPH
jgi:hypothetical protein